MRRLLASVAVLSLGLGGCAWSEEARIAAYFESAESLAQRMVDTGTSFEALMEEQQDPLAWNGQTRDSLDAVYDDVRNLRDEASSMTVPEAFVAAHPLLVQSLDHMLTAVDIIRGIAADPSTATYEKANEMTAEAEQGEQLANEYVAEIERILAEKYPEMVEEE